MNKIKQNLADRLIQYALELNDIDETEVTEDQIEVKEKIKSIKNNINEVVSRQ